MITVGNYIHLLWDNYLKYGNNPKSKKEGNSINPAEILRQNADEVYNLINFLKKYSNNAIKELENQYNNINQMGLKSLERSLKHAQSAQQNSDARHTLKLLITQINNNFEDVAEQIINHLEVRDGMLVYTGAPLAAKTTLQKYYHKSGQWYDITHLKEYCMNIIKKISSTDMDIEEKNKDLIALGSIHNDLIKIQKHKDDLKYIVSKVNARLDNKPQILVDESWKANKKYNSYNKKLIPEEIGKPYDKAIFSIYGKILSVEEINRILAYRLPEVLGSIAEYNSNKITQETLKKTLEDFVNKTKTETSQKLVQVNLDDLTILDENKNPLFKMHQSLHGGSLELNTMLNSKSSSGVEQKVDVVFNINVDDKSSLSIKTTDFSEAYEAWNDQDNFSKYSPSFNKIISLQGSSALLYLLGMEREFGKGIINHYLNILAHPSENIPDSLGKDTPNNSIKALALDNLKQYMIYSALTGNGQLRKAADGSANILAIYDKNKNNSTSTASKVKFISMYDILNQDNWKDGFLFNPALNTLKLTNKYVAPSSPDRPHEGIGERIGNILEDARKAKFKIYITKNYLQNLKNLT